MHKEQAIVEAAAARFRYYGISKTTMQEIAQDAGVAVGTLYLYFTNKDSLVAACAEKYAERHREQAEAILASDRPADEKLRAYVLARFRQAAETRTGSRHAAEITRAVLRVKPNRIREEGEMMLAVTREILQAGGQTGLFHIENPRRDAMVFLYSLVAFFPHALSEPQVVPEERDLRAVLDWFLDRWKRDAAAQQAATQAGKRKRTTRGGQSRPRRG